MMIENLKDINAVWANKTATTTLGEIAKKQLTQILINIKDAAGNNKFSANSSSIEEINQTELKSRGFKIKYYDGDPRDQREHGYYTISW